MSTHATPASPSRSQHRRVAYAGLCALIVAVIVVELARRGGGYGQLAAFGLAPDLALVFGAGAGLAKGQLHPRAVTAYNLLHRFWGPAALATLTIAGVLPAAFVIGALAWTLHVALDRTVGYGLRTRDGFQRS
jgi:uncharacterized protein DUF4260